MGLLAFGINHKTASVDIRERLAFTPDRLNEALLLLGSQEGIQELVILSTCNRTEIYCASLANQSDVIADWLGEFHRVDAAKIKQFSYEKSDAEAVRHLLRVASGLDSLVLGEPQILGQLKSAYQSAKQADAVGSHLEKLFQHAFSVAKQVRTETAIGVNPVSVASAAVALARHIFSDLKDTRALLIGAGETTELVLQHLKQNNVGDVWVANRTFEKAKELSDRVNGIPITLPEIPGALDKVDIIVSSTASPLPILGKGMVEAALKRRRHKPLFLIDLAVPRDVEPEVAELADAYLYTVDDLHDTVSDNQRQRQAEATAAEKMVLERAMEFMRQVRELDAVGTLRGFRKKVEQIREEELKKAVRSLGNGMAPEEAMARMSRALVNKLMHTPSVELRRAGASGRDDLLLWAQSLFGLDLEPGDTESVSIQIVDIKNGQSSVDGGEVEPPINPAHLHNGHDVAPDET